MKEKSKVATLNFALKLHANLDCTFKINLNLPVLEHVALDHCCVPVIPSVLSVVINTYSPERSKHFVVPNGVRKLQTDYNLKEYPDSILDLEILEFDPQTAPPFPRSLRYLRLDGRNFCSKFYGLDGHGRNLLQFKDIEFPPSLYMLSGAFDERELREFNLRARKTYENLTQDMHS